MAKNSIMLDLNDPRAGKIAEVISNSTSKKILSLLAEKELSESEISSQLNLPMNTIGYNIKKLMESELIEKTKEYFWSVKGKRIPTYTISNKRIIISPKSMVKGIIPTILISGFIGLLIKNFITPTRIINPMDSINAIDAVAPAIQEGASGGASASGLKVGADYAQESLARGTDIAVQSLSTQSPEIWAWFLLGALSGLLIFLLWNTIAERRKN